MSGHSKWSTIKRKKGVKDAQKGMLFTKLAKEITVAARVGGGNIDMNFRLRLAVQKAKENNMPNTNIERAVKRGTGEGGELVVYEEVIYEGYGPGGFAVYIEGMTDNRNRASSTIRHDFSKYGGNLGETGCVAWMFQPRGSIVVRKKKNLNTEETLLELIDSGADDVTVSEDETYTLLTEVEHFCSVKERVVSIGYDIVEEELTRIPQNTVKITDEKIARQALSLLNALDDNEDVQKVYANCEIDDSIVE